MGDIVLEGFQKQKPKENSKGTNTPKRNTGARVALAAVGIIAVLGTGIATAYFGLNIYNKHKETKRAESLIASYIDEDKLVSFPQTVAISQAYDLEYCSGEKLVSELTESGAAYCIIDGEYYTEKGETIAVLTLDVTRISTVEPVEEEIGGQTIYMAPTGYELKNGVCTKEVVTRETKVVKRSENGDYSHVMVEGASKATVVSVEEVDTKKYSSLNNYDLIVDVEDSTELTDGVCEGQLVLKKR